MKSSYLSEKQFCSILIAVPALLTAAGALVYFLYRRDMTEAYERVFSGSKLANTRLGLIEYGDVGSGIPVFVVHGAGGGFDQGLELARPLIENGCRVIAPSRFGYLRTPVPKDASPMAQADAHAALLDSLQLDKVAVVGVSAGAPSAMQLCFRHPERCTALVLVVPLAYSAQLVAATVKPGSVRQLLISAAISSDFVFWTMSKLARKAMFKTLLGTPPSDLKHAGASEQRRVTEFLKHIEPIRRRKAGLLNEAEIAKSLPRYDLEHLRVPTLVIGVEDCLYNTYPAACYTAQNIPGAQLLGFREGGHLAVGHEREMWSAVNRFFKTTA